MKRSANIDGVLVFLCLAFASFGQGDDTRPWEKYGLSQNEWKLVKDSSISLDKVQTLLSAGISIGEYCVKQWKAIGLTEGEWIEKRRAGLTSYDIALEAQADRRWKAGVAPDASSGYASYSSVSNQFISLIIPGFQQLRLKQTTRGRIMIGLAAASLAACIGGTMYDIHNRLEIRPLYFGLAPDMLWSFIDFKISIGKMNRRKK